MSRSDGNGVPWRGILVAVVVGYGFGYMHGERGERHDCRERVASLPWEVPKARRLRQLLHPDSYLLDEVCGGVSTGEDWDWQD